MSQVAENNGHDFLLRLGQYLKDGGIARWAQQLVPWLSASQQRVPLRGLMFSLPENKPAAIAGETAGAAPAEAEKYIPESQRHALTLPVTWQGIVDDCIRVRGRRVGMAWEQTLAWTLMTIICVWGQGRCCRLRLTGRRLSPWRSRRMLWWSILPYRITS